MNGIVGKLMNLFKSDEEPVIVDKASLMKHLKDNYTMDETLQAIVDNKDYQKTLGVDDKALAKIKENLTHNEEYFRKEGFSSFSIPYMLNIGRASNRQALDAMGFGKGKDDVVKWKMFNQFGVQAKIPAEEGYYDPASWGTKKKKK